MGSLSFCRLGLRVKASTYSSPGSPGTFAGGHCEEVRMACDHLKNMACNILKNTVVAAISLAALSVSVASQVYTIFHSRMIESQPGASTPAKMYRWRARLLVMALGVEYSNAPIPR